MQRNTPKIAEIRRNGAAFQAFRGTDWMEEPCRSCDRRFHDHGGRRCQAFAFGGRAEAVAPACSFSPLREELVSIASREADQAASDFVYRAPKTSRSCQDRGDLPEPGDGFWFVCRTSKNQPAPSGRVTCLSLVTGSGLLSAGLPLAGFGPDDQGIGCPRHC